MTLEGVLEPSCPQCAEPVSEQGAGWVCPLHGEQPPLWRPSAATYDAFLDHLGRATGFPTLLPWPMGPGWQVSDFGVVAAPGRPPLATVACCSGMSELDGAVDLHVVS